jgi:hypothetical protein
MAPSRASINRRAQAVITRLSSSTLASSQGNSITIPKPSIFNADNVMVAMIAFRPSTWSSGIQISANSWTKDKSLTTNGRDTLTVFYKVYTAADVSTSSYVFNASTWGSFEGVVISFSGVNTTNPKDGSNGVATQSCSYSSTSYGTGSITPTSNNVMLVTGFSVTNLDTWTCPGCGNLEASISMLNMLKLSS